MRDWGIQFVSGHFNEENVAKGETHFLTVSEICCHLCHFIAFKKTLTTTNVRVFSLIALSLCTLLKLLPSSLIGAARTRSEWLTGVVWPYCMLHVASYCMLHVASLKVHKQGLQQGLNLSWNYAIGGKNKNQRWISTRVAWNTSFLSWCQSLLPEARHKKNKNHKEAHKMCCVVSHVLIFDRSRNKPLLIAQ